MTVVVLIFGEITPKMAAAVSESSAKKVLIPVSRCAVSVVGVQEKPLAEYVREAVQRLLPPSAKQRERGTTHENGTRLHAQRDIPEI